MVFLGTIGLLPLIVLRVYILKLGCSGTIRIYNSHTHQHGHTGQVAMKLQLADAHLQIALQYVSQSYDPLDAFQFFFGHGCSSLPPR